jgi:hypothetical protein
MSDDANAFDAKKKLLEHVRNPVVNPGFIL